MSRLRRPRWPALLAVGFALTAGASTWAWETDSGYYAFLPQDALPAAEAVKADGGDPPAPGSGFYFLTVSVLHTNEIQKLWAEHWVDGAELVPEDRILAPGQSDEQRRSGDLRAMTDAKTTAQIVAERALGRPVRIDHLGARVEAVQPGLPAERSGVRAGAVIVAAGGHPVGSATDLIDAMRRLSPGDPVTLEFAGGQTRRLTTVASPDDGRAVVGVSIGDAVRVGPPPVPVKISTPGIGGPSAGLAFALEIYDSLSGRKLLRGHRIAVTGEIDLDGGVHAIGGVHQKALSAIDAGADLLIVPTDNLADAREAAAGRVRVVGVDSFEGALAAVRALPVAS